MRWQDGRRSDNVDDRRGSPGRKVAGGAGALTLIMAVVAFLVNKDPRALLDIVAGSGAVTQQGQAQERTEYTAEEQQLADFAKVVLGYTEDVWRQLFRQEGKTYRDPTLVLFSGSVDSACGFADAAVGPFYCPGDGNVYIDLSFFGDLARRHGAPGDFAQAYVIAHEIGHHVQNLLGISDQVHEQRARLSEAEYNQLSVRLELQADFFAGVWAHHAHQAARILESGDVEEALNAASAIGDDRLQRQARGYVTPDSFTHGTSAQRVKWFRKGLESGDLAQGDTFNARDL